MKTDEIWKPVTEKVENQAEKQIYKNNCCGQKIGFLNKLYWSICICTASTNVILYTLCIIGTHELVCACMCMCKWLNR